MFENEKQIELFAVRCFDRETKDSLLCLASKVSIDQMHHKNRCA